MVRGCYIQIYMYIYIYIFIFIYTHGHIVVMYIYIYYTNIFINIHTDYFQHAMFALESSDMPHSMLTSGFHPQVL